MFKPRRHFLRRNENILAEKTVGGIEDSGAPARAHRFTSRNGHVNILKMGLSRRQPMDWFHLLMTISWPWVIGITAAAYLVINCFFGLLYWLDPYGVAGLAPSDYPGHFFYSSHVFSTLGFSYLYPIDLYTNLLTTLESFIGWCSFGLITGLLFSRFSRPTARVIFSHNATIEPYDGKPTFVFRAANRRGNLILQARASVTLSRNEKTLEGENIRRLYDLKLVRDVSSVFNLTWSVRHIIDETSPLHKQTAEMLRDSETEVMVLLTGTDDSFGQTVHGHFSYNHEEILFDQHFASMFRREKGGVPIIDFSKFDRVEPATAHAGKAETSSYSD